MDVGLVQLAYDEAIFRVLHDLGAQCNLRPHVEVDLTGPDPDLPYLFRHEGNMHRAAIPLVDVEPATVHLADLVQDDVLQALWGDVWPRCAGHPHPARPAKVDGRAVWTCPRTGEVLCLIGELTP